MGRGPDGRRWSRPRGRAEGRDSARHIRRDVARRADFFETGSIRFIAKNAPPRQNTPGRAIGAL